MEELTIEQKAQRYDEILARAKGANMPYYEEDIMSKVKEFVDYLLPELKENGDERIRKNCIHFLELQKQHHAATFEIEECISWLESLKDRVGCEANCTTTKEWSEEDEEMWLDAIKYLELFDAQGIHGNKAVPCINWLKSLKDKVQPQNLTVTDEELAQAKKDAYNDVLDKIEYDSENPTFDDGWSAAIWYLKKRNAIPQSQWKPTEKQLKSLEIACDRNDIVGYRLAQILKELKKLKGK